MTTPKRKVFVRLFYPEFAGLVESGQKCQTVRPVPKRMPKAGDTISLRCWTGLPRRSKQRILRESVITEVLPIVIIEQSITVDRMPLTYTEQWFFARADGFVGRMDMLHWFEDMHGMPFKGIVIRWRK